MKDYYGYIGLCSMGKLGLITSHGPIKVTYSDGNIGYAHQGIQLTDTDEETQREYQEKFGNHNPLHPANFIGGPWSSRDPLIIGHMIDVITFYREA